MEVLRSILMDNENNFNNKINDIQPNSVFNIPRSKCKVEFIHITHSTLQSTMMALHTPEGIVLYANDFKFDNSPQCLKTSLRKIL
jgi:ribonuclease J